MTDKELLELAAKAAGVDGDYQNCVDGVWINQDERPHQYWNPIDNDGDALRLAVKLKFDVVHGEEHVFVGNVLGDCWKASECTFNIDPYAATRRAIVRAAAEIGKGMK